MPSRTILAVAAAVIAGVLAAQDGQPQNPPQPRPPRAQQTSSSQPPPPQKYTIRTPEGGVTATGWLEQDTDRPLDVLALEERVTIDFKGGTVAEYIQAVRTAATPKAVNILVPAEVSDVPLPPIKLQSVTLWAAWSAIEPAIRAQGSGLEVEVQALGGRMGSPVSSEAVQIVTNRQYVANPLQSKSGRAIENVEVISIADLVEPRPSTGEALMKVDDLLMAVEAAAKVAAEAGNPIPTLKFHSASGVLISRGGPGANSLVNEVVSTIRKNASVRAEQQDRTKAAKDIFDQRLAEFRIHYESAAEVAESAGRRMADSKKLLDAGSIPVTDFQIAKDQYSEAARQAAGVKQQLETLERLGYESILVTMPMRGQGGTSDLGERVMQLEREVESLKAQIAAWSRSPGKPGR